MDIERSVTVDRPHDAVFAYLSDFTTTTEWDPGTLRTERISGDGGVGTRYRNTSTFLGRETQLDYVVTERVPGRRFALRGENATVIAHDTMTFDPNDVGTTVTYRADFEFKGITKVVAPLFAPALRKLVDEAEQGMRDALMRLE